MLTNPADEFVEQFVGADRSLKRLALQRVRDVDLWKVATAAKRATTSASCARRWSDTDLPDLALLLDDEGRPESLAARARPAGRHACEAGGLPARAGARPRRHPARRARRPARAWRAATPPVVDADGKMAGVLSIEVIAHALNLPRGERSHRERADQRVSVTVVVAQLGDDFFQKRTGTAACGTTASARTGSPTTSTSTSARWASTSSSRSSRVAVGFADRLHAGDRSPTSGAG